MKTPTSAVHQVRRTLGALEQISEASAAGCNVVLTGPGVNDLLIDHKERALWLPDLLRSYATDSEKGLVIWRLETQPNSYATLPGQRAVTVKGIDSRAHPADVVRGLLADVLNETHQTILVIEYADLVLPREADLHDLLRASLVEQIQALASDRCWRTAGHQLVLVDRGSGLMTRVVNQPGNRTVRLDAPDHHELEVFINKKTKATSDRRLHLAPGLSVNRSSTLAGGLLIRDINEAAPLTTPTTPLDEHGLSQMKGDALARQGKGTLILLDEPVDFATDVAGVPAIRFYLERLQKTGRSTARILLAGPPGTGKTYSARAIARTMGIPLVRFGKIHGELMGQTEEFTDTALATLTALAPAAVEWGEIDQSGGGTRSSSGASSEAYQGQRAKFFDALSNPHDDSGFTVIASTNVPTPRFVDTAALDRFEVIPVLPGSAAEVTDVVRIHARQSGITLGPRVSDAIQAYLASGKVISNRTATEVVFDALFAAVARGSATVDGEDFETVLNARFHDDWTPDVEYSTLTSILASKKEWALPWVAATHLGEQYEAPLVLHPYFHDSGRFNSQHAIARVEELERAGAYRG